MKYSFTRVEARCVPKLNNRENVIVDLVVGMTGVQESTGLTAYRDTMVSLPEPTDEDWVPFADITEEWCKPILEKTAENNKWKESIEGEIKALQTRPVTKPLPWQMRKADG